MPTKLILPASCAGLRLDQALTMLLPGLTRAQIQRLIREGGAIAAGRALKAAQRVREGQEVEVTIPKVRPLHIVPEEIEFDVLFEDQHLLVINKPAGLVVHPAAGHSQGTLVHGLLHHCRDLSGIGGVLRPGIVHRLDKDTSGAMVVAKGDAAHQGMVEAFGAYRVEKKYLALVWGHPDIEGSITTPIGRHPVDRKRMSGAARHAKPALSCWRVVNYYTGGLSLLMVTIKTGRTHQIRVHLSEAGFPLVGDLTYAAKKARNPLPGVKVKPVRQMLHAAYLAFNHPLSGRRIKITAPLPKDMRTLLHQLKVFKI